MRIFLSLIGFSFLLFLALALYFFTTREQTPMLYESRANVEIIQKFHEVRKQLIALPVEKHSYGLSTVATNQGVPIDWAKENKASSQFIQFLKAQGKKLHLVIVPGFVPPTDKPIRLHRFNKIRLNMAVQEINAHKGAVILLSGGNVKPAGTPFNEAMEMKKRLLRVHQVPEYRVAIEPNAQNTVTNFRNAGRFMLAHDIKTARVVTTFIQNFYISFPILTFFETRSKELLGFEVGKFSMKGLGSSDFIPSKAVFTKGKSPKDP